MVGEGGRPARPHLGRDNQRWQRGNRPLGTPPGDDWSSVDHCCPNTAPATPVILAGLLDDDEDVQRTAVHDLGQVVTHQNSIYGATAPAARFVIAILGHPRTMTLGVYPHGERRRPMRAALLEWLGDLA